jgi:hypothetical protein
MYRQNRAFTKEATLRASWLCIGSLLLFGQSACAEDNDKLFGAWKIVSAVVEDVQTNEQKPLYGEHPKGYLILLASGRMMSLLVSDGRKAPQTGLKATNGLPSPMWPGTKRGSSTRNATSDWKAINFISRPNLR